MSVMKHFFVAILCATSAGCALPQGGILFSASPLTAKSTKLKEVPSDWDGRVFRIGSGGTRLDGEERHWHMMRHVENGVSSPTQSALRPFGLNATAAKLEHVHDLSSSAQYPDWTGPAFSMPPSVELLASRAEEPLTVIPTGSIIAFTGGTIPTGWLLCDGRGGTPRLDEVYVLIRSHRLTGAQVGSATHDHDVSHSHKWETSPPTTQNSHNWAFADIVPSTQGGNIDFNPVKHQHYTEEVGRFEGRSGLSSVRPPSIRVMYLQASRNLRSLPTGTLIPFDGNGIPLGWARCEGSLMGVFPYATLDSGRVGERTGTLTHSHKVTTAHHVELRSSASVVTGRLGQGPELATGDHGHTATITGEFDLEPARNNPLSVTLPFLMKK